LHDFFRAASVQGGLSHERNVCLSVCPSVCLSDKRVNKKLRQKERNFCPYFRI